MWVAPACYVDVFLMSLSTSFFHITGASWGSARHNSVANRTVNIQATITHLTVATHSRKTYVVCPPRGACLPP